MSETQQEDNTAKLLGTDLALDSDGNFTVSFRNGYYDRATISGDSNLGQALFARLRATGKFLNSRLPGSLPAHPDYGVGILSLISEPYSEVLQKARTQIISNFASESRIKPLESSDIIFTWDSNKRLLEIKISYTPINSEIAENLVFPLYIS